MDNPGPGQYQQPVMLGDAPKFGFGKEKRVTSARNDNPGPGQYSSGLSNLKKAPVYSISSVRPKTAGGSSVVPGPGQYSVTMTDRPKSPSYK